MKRVILIVCASIVAFLVIGLGALAIFGHDAPAVTGESLSSAKTKVRAVGLTLKVEGTGAGPVCHQDPEVGHRLWPGDPITVSVGTACGRRNGSAPESQSREPVTRTAARATPTPSTTTASTTTPSKARSTERPSRQENGDLTAGVHRSSTFDTQCVENLDTGGQFCGDAASEYCQAIGSNNAGRLPHACRAFYDRALVEEPPSAFDRDRDRVSRTISRRGRSACHRQYENMKSYLGYICDAYTDIASCVDATKNYRQVDKCRSRGRQLIAWAECSAEQLRKADFQSDCGERPDVTALRASF